MTDTDDTTPAVGYRRQAVKMLGLPIDGYPNIYEYLTILLHDRSHSAVRTHTYADGRSEYHRRLWGGTENFAMFKSEFPNAVEYDTTISSNEYHRLYRPTEQGSYWDNRDPANATFLRGNRVGLPDDFGDKNLDTYNRLYQWNSTVSSVVSNAMHNLNQFNLGLLDRMRNIRLPLDPRKPTVDWMVPFYTGYIWSQVVASGSVNNANDPNKQGNITASCALDFHEFVAMWGDQPLLEADVEALFNRTKYLTYDYDNNRLAYKTGFELPDHRVAWADQICFIHPIPATTHTDNPIWE